MSNLTTSNSKGNVQKKKHDVERKVYAAGILNWPIAFVLSIGLAPIWLINVLIGLLRNEDIFTFYYKIDALGRSVKLRTFKHGLAIRTAVLLDVLAGNMSILGVPTSHSMELAQQQKLLSRFKAPTGIWGHYDVHRVIGLEEVDPFQLLNQQLNQNVIASLGLLLKVLMTITFYHKSSLHSPKVAPLFGLNIDNVSIRSAVNWSVNNELFANKDLNSSFRKSNKVGFFVNAHSVNLSSSNQVFKACLQRADALFADGSGMRVAAKHAGIKLNANVNGTDMLPVLCDMAQKQGKSIYLLGGKETVANRAAKNLRQQFPNLVIAGSHHGFVDFNDSEVNLDIVNEINASQADILLVGLGSPMQEYWCEQQANELNCETVLAVGGLFDFFAGDIPRAPIVLRELGLEWLWRLAQEPATKFKRYVIGTPEFLFRTFILQQVK